LKATFLRLSLNFKIYFLCSEYPFRFEERDSGNIIFYNLPDDCAFGLFDFKLALKSRAKSRANQPRAGGLSTNPTGCIPVLQVCPLFKKSKALHSPTPSPKTGEGEPEPRSLSRFGRGI
jgi:hypothetical protein